MCCNVKEPVSQDKQGSSDWGERTNGNQREPKSTAGLSGNQSQAQNHQVKSHRAILNSLSLLCIKKIKANVPGWLVNIVKTKLVILIH